MPDYTRLACLSMYEGDDYYGAYMYALQVEDVPVDTTMVPMSSMSVEYHKNGKFYHNINTKPTYKK